MTHHARVPRRAALPAAALCAVAALLALAAAPALAARGHVFEKTFASPGAGAGELSEPQGVATNEATGDVYVADSRNNRIDEFTSAGAFVRAWGFDVVESGPDNTGTGFEVCNALEHPTDVCKAGTASSLAGGFNRPKSLAVDNHPSSPSHGDVYVGDYYNNRIEKFSPTGAFEGQLTEAGPGVALDEITGVAVDPAGGLWVAYKGGNFFGRHVANFDDAVSNDFVATRELKSVPNEVDVGSCNKVLEPGLAVDSEHNLYVHLGFGVLNPELQEVCKFNSNGEAAGRAFQSEEIVGGVALEAPDRSLYVADLEAVARLTTGGTLLERFGSGHLTAGSGIAVNAASQTVYVADAAADRVAIFPPEPPGPPTIEAGSESVTAVTADGATLGAEINPRSEPGEGPTSYRFEYGTCPSLSACPGSPYTQSVPVPDGTVPPDFELHSVSAGLAGLLPHTVYHFRALAHNSQPGTPGHPEIAAGEEQTFTTPQATGAESALLDNRAWELVSPPNKHGALIWVTPNGSVIQASASGGAITYSASGPIEAGAQSNLVYDAQVLSRRGSGGAWSSREINAPNNVVAGVAGTNKEYRFFSEDLSLGLLVPPPGTSLTEAALSSTPYLTATACEPLSPPTACYTPLLSTADVPAGTEPILGSVGGFQGAAPDLGHVILDSEMPLTKTPGDQGGLYEWSAAASPGQPLRLVSVLPDDTSTNCAKLGEGEGSEAVRGAVSRDGSRVVWRTQTGSRCPGSPHIYLRDLAVGETIQLDTGSAAPRFQIASADGSRIFFGNSNSSLEVCEVSLSEATGKLEPCRLTPLSPSLQGNVLGASQEDGSYVYFVAAGNVLTVAHFDGAAWQTKPIATLSGGDAPDWNANLRDQTARVSPNGRWLAFMSREPLTGYDNRDAVSGERDEEVYLYDAQTSNLVCASCNPTGARPLGVEVSRSTPLLGETGFGPWRGRWLAASLSDWTGTSLFEPPGHQPRYLLDSGRLFFNAHDPLVPHAKNGSVDVYEYEPPGLGNCNAESPTYSERSGGCLGLVSAGTSAEESIFLDASESGDDAFFLTTAKLASQDVDSAYDVYDAHVCSSESPCAAPPAASPPCTTADSCRAAPQAQPPLFGSAPSAAYSGPGNLRQPRPRCAKGKARKHGRCLEKPKAKKHRRHHRRSHRNRRTHR